VHVAVAAPAYKVNCNTAIIENDDGLMVVDTHSKPSRAGDRGAPAPDVEQARAYVVNTHFHWTTGTATRSTAAYPNAEIVTNNLTREAMVKKAQAHPDHVRQCRPRSPSWKPSGGRARDARTKLENDCGWPAPTSTRSRR